MNAPIGVETVLALKDERDTLRSQLDQAVALLSDAHNQLRFAIECQHGGIGICANCKRAIETMRATQDAFLSSLPGSAEAKGTR